MIRIYTYLCLLFFLAPGLSLWGQELLDTKDFDVPQETIELVKKHAVFNLDDQSLTVPPEEEVYVFSKAKLSKYRKESPTKNLSLEENYTYKDGELVSKKQAIRDTLGLEYTNYKYRTEDQDYKKTFYKIHPNVGVEKRIEFYNDAGELRGKSIYNSKNQRTAQIEYGGKEGYRIKKYDEEALTSDIIYLYDEQAKILQIIMHTVPGNKSEAKVIKEISYNDTGDQIKLVEYHPVKDGGVQHVNKSYYTDYLYDGALWVAKIEYNTGNGLLDKFMVTTRDIKTPKRNYKPQSDEQLIDFCKEVYQKYLKLKRE